MTSISQLYANISQKLDIVGNNTSTNSTRLSAVEHRVDELDKSVKTYVDAKLKSAINQVSKSSLDKTIPPNAFKRPFEALKKEIKSLKHKQLCDKNAISIISETIANVKDQIESTIVDSRSSSLNDTTHPSRPRLNRDNERILIHDSIESSAKLIRQLIAVKVSSHSELSSIKKSNDDIKKVTAYTKTCQKSFMKYIT